MRRIELVEFSLKPFQILDLDWALLVGGTEHPNPMTVSWGGFGTLWNRPVVTVYVRPTRHTFSLLNETAAFTLNFLPERWRSAMDLCGSKSGRDVDKWQATGLHAQASEHIEVPRVAEASLVLECRTVARFDLAPEHFLDATLHKNYPQHDYHRAFVGQVLGAWRDEG
ncbi:MAG: flavin reductase family protein [Pseudomonadota bacterium]